MLTVGLHGSIAARLDAFKRLKLLTPVNWIDLQKSDSIRALDLVIQLRADSPGFNHRLLVTWDHIPAVGTVDDALQASLAHTYGFIVGFSEAMHRVCRWIQVLTHPVAQSISARAMIVGETGVGKELVARAIQRIGRAGQPFAALNCAALPRDLIASELFGHVRGAFTGAHLAREGAFSIAGTGVLFLDEVSELPLELQPVLLRALEECVYSPLGSSQQLPLQAQILTATNRPIPELVDRGAMRADLYFRLAQTVIAVPPLSDRSDDIPLLARYFWRAMAQESPPEDLVGELAQRSWPGNVRQLRSTVERAVMLESSLGKGAWEEALDRGAPTQATTPRRTLADLRDAFEREILLSVLRRHGWDLALVAHELGITRRSVYNLLKRHEVPLDPGKEVR